ncbi:unnamed protein product [Amoebophrya sp. A25]|nr:unnamed protein product [Amoebophrya sp. A25]|eukprot:GSA25T00010380001.1
MIAELVPCGHKLHFECLGEYFRSCENEKNVLSGASEAVLPRMILRANGQAHGGQEDLSRIERGVHPASQLKNVVCPLCRGDFFFKKKVVQDVEYEDEFASLCASMLGCGFSSGICDHDDHDPFPLLQEERQHYRDGHIKRNSDGASTTPSGDELHSGDGEQDEGQILRRRHVLWKELAELKVERAEEPAFEQREDLKQKLDAVQGDDTMFEDENKEKKPVSSTSTDSIKPNILPSRSSFARRVLRSLLKKKLPSPSCVRRSMRSLFRTVSRDRKRRKRFLRTVAALASLPSKLCKPPVVDAVMKKLIGRSLSFATLELLVTVFASFRTYVFLFSFLVEKGPIKTDTLLQYDFFESDFVRRMYPRLVLCVIFETLVAQALCQQKLFSGANLSPQGLLIRLNRLLGRHLPKLHQGVFGPRDHGLSFDPVAAEQWGVAPAGSSAPFGEGGGGDGAMIFATGVDPFCDSTDESVGKSKLLTFTDLLLLNLLHYGVYRPMRCFHYILAEEFFQEVFYPDLLEYLTTGEEREVEGDQDSPRHSADSRSSSSSRTRRGFSKFFQREYMPKHRQELFGADEGDETTTSSFSSGRRQWEENYPDVDQLWARALDHFERLGYNFDDDVDELEDLHQVAENGEDEVHLQDQDQEEKNSAVLRDEQKIVEDEDKKVLHRNENGENKKKIAVENLRSCFGSFGFLFDFVPSAVERQVFYPRPPGVTVEEYYDGQNGHIGTEYIPVNRPVIKDFAVQAFHKATSLAGRKKVEKKVKSLLRMERENRSSRRAGTGSGIDGAEHQNLSTRLSHVSSSASSASGSCAGANASGTSRAIFVENSKEFESFRSFCAELKVLCGANFKPEKLEAFRDRVMKDKAARKAKESLKAN